MRKPRGLGRKVRDDVRRVRAMPDEEFYEEGSDYAPEHTLVGRSLACSVCGALGAHNCIPAMVELVLRSKTLQNACFELIEACSNNPQVLEELTEDE